MILHKVIIFIGHEDTLFYTREKTLDINERSELLNRHKKEREGRIKDHIKAVLLYDDDWTPPR